MSGIWTAIGTAVGSFFGMPMVGAAVGGAIDGKMASNEAGSQAGQSESFQYAMAQQARAFNSAEASKTRDWQQSMFDKATDYDTMMSNSAYQRATADMRAAGINPMLAVMKGGASTPTAPMPSGATASTSPSGSVDRSGVVLAGLRAAEVAQARAESNARITNLRQDTILKEAQTARETSSAGNIEQNTALQRTEVAKIEEEIRSLKISQGTDLWRQTLMNSQVELNRVEQALKGHNITFVEAETALTRIRTLLARLAEPQARNAANAQDSWWMQNVSPYLGEVGKITGPARDLAPYGRMR